MGRASSRKRERHEAARQEPFIRLDLRSALNVVCAATPSPTASHRLPTLTSAYLALLSRPRTGEVEATHAHLEELLEGALGLRTAEAGLPSAAGGGAGSMTSCRLMLEPKSQLAFGGSPPAHAGWVGSTGIGRGRRNVGEPSLDEFFGLRRTYRDELWDSQTRCGCHLTRRDRTGPGIPSHSAPCWALL